MKRFLGMLAILGSMGTYLGAAERPERTPPAPTGTLLTTGEVTPTPDMWFYEQAMRNYQDPKMAVRKRAEARADAREQRIAALKWFGYSNARPRANSDPYNTDYSPAWASNNVWSPYQWTGVGPAWVPVEVQRSRVSGY